MSKVELVVYDVLKNRGYSEECRFLVVSSTSGSGSNIAHLSVHVHEEEFEFGDGGINISLEPVRIERNLIFYLKTEVLHYSYRNLAKT